MVTLIDEVIEARLTGGAVASVGSDGTNLANESLENLRQLRAQYARAASAAGGIQFFKAVNKATSAT